ncbi:2-succinyl-6-hydroxy-2, 4-cyclohexadiene-1-carboxylate synthase [Paraburkholderia caffeinitolerans]|uniref:2-succinyl-6-hydroxy-2, 4-cyclohexadiene-1-carboxylate synthase n=1 Tax=Paraburkholderia caffeinitolerans TaxID=1723730 RepID=A0A6J5GID9_9BURK|nr:alpha/beta hydrolase [Paraburkholderia caffeinitolerans]CAB3800841.1 2-succinyl-6-hydroxy-2, 4-cyclohexadiene-1-carboxylate synthase [Paraburkholderia caffeinitolerans]
MDEFAIDDRGNFLRYFDLYSGSEAFEPLFYIHGLGCASSSDYPPVVSANSYAQRRSLLVDLMGSGFSDKPPDGTYHSQAQAAVLSDFVASQGCSRVTLFGHSAGAFIALKLAQKLPIQVSTLILCEPGLTEYGIAMLSEIASQTEAQFVDGGFAQLLAQLKIQGGNDAWLGPFSVASPHAIHQWAQSAIEDNSSHWLDDLANLNAIKGVVLSDTATRDQIAKFEQAGCTVELVADTEHMIAYDNPDGLALAISNLLDLGK